MAGSAPVTFSITLASFAGSAGIQFAYHNHNHEFRVYDGVIAYDQLLSSTDPALVKMELDCFWMTFAGKDPVEYMHKYPGRFPLLHIKGLKAGYKPTTGHFEGNPFTEVGNGVIDWKRIFEAAHVGGMKHYYVEQDHVGSSFSRKRGHQRGLFEKAPGIEG